MVQEYCHASICGNHDLHAILKLPSNHAMIGIPHDWYEMDLNDRIKATGNRFWLYEDEIVHPISDETAKFIRDLPEQLVIDAGRFNLLATHFVSPDITGHKQEAPSILEDFREHLRRIRRNRCLVGLAGHAHLEGYAQITRKALGMNYFREGELMRRTQLIVAPAITRSKARSGYLLLDTENFKFEAVPLD
jgi:hypothetical protein